MKHGIIYLFTITMLTFTQTAVARTETKALLKNKAPVAKAQKGTLNLGQHLDIENMLQGKISSFIQSYDPEATVFVVLKPKLITTSLPGLSNQVLTVTQNGFAQTMSSDDVKSIEIHIRLTKHAMATQIETDLRSLLQNYAVPINLKINKVKSTKENEKVTEKEDPLLQVFKSDYLINLMHSLFEPLKKPLRDFAFIVLGVFSFFFILKLITGSLLQSKLIKTIALKATSSEAPAPQSTMYHAPQVTQQQEARNSSDETAGIMDVSVRNLQRLPFESFKALLSDCYWCQEADYAAWIWRNSSPVTQKKFLEDWPYAKDFIVSLRKQKPFNIDLHSHPAYLNPVSMTDLSQEDLANMIKENPSLWHTLSPLRRDHIPLDLKTKVACRRSEITDIKSLTYTPSAARTDLNSDQSWGRMTVDDEQMIFVNPDIFEADEIPFVSTLCWLALSEETQRRAILTQYNAQTLAEAWIGPKAVLDLIDKVLPESKRELLKSYRQSSTANKNSESYRALVQAGAKAYIDGLNKKSTNTTSVQEPKVSLAA